jgi:hypothetical protein
MFFHDKHSAVLGMSTFDPKGTLASVRADENEARSAMPSGPKDRTDGQFERQHAWTAAGAPYEALRERAFRPLLACRRLLDRDGSVSRVHPGREYSDRARDDRRAPGRSGSTRHATRTEVRGSGWREPLARRGRQPSQSRFQARSPRRRRTGAALAGCAGRSRSANRASATRRPARR